MARRSQAAEAADAPADASDCECILRRAEDSLARVAGARGIPIAETVQHFPRTNLQIACLPQYPEGRGGCSTATGVRGEGSDGQQESVP